MPVVAGRWLRLHSPPRKWWRGATLGGREEWSAKARWYYDRSLERWERRPDSQELVALGHAALIKGELGRLDGFRFIVSKSPHA